jgi:FkbM family methyltransferase
MEATPFSELFVPIQVPGIPPFRLCVGGAEARGATGYGRDPVAEYIVTQQAPPSLLLIRLALALTRPGQLVCDLGAHVGEITLSLAASGRRVLAVEASPRNQHLLALGIEANGLGSRVELVRAAAGDRSGELRFIVAGPYSCVAGGDDPRAVVVPSIRVGDVLANRDGPVGLIKLDVEGFEGKAIEGLAGWLSSRADPPPLLYESNLLCHVQTEGADCRVWRQLVGLGYRHRYLVTHPDVLTELHDDDPQPVVVADVLATRTALTDLAGFRLRGPLDDGSFLQLLNDDLANYQQDAVALAALARSLQASPAPLLRRPRIRFHLGRLSRHPLPAVRSAFGRWEGEGGFVGWTAEQMAQLRAMAAHRLRQLSALPGRLVRRIRQAG